MKTITEKQKRAWIDALESGRFIQGNGSLAAHHSVSDCKYGCLGVYACAVQHRATDNLIGEGFLSARAMPFELQAVFATFNDKFNLSFAEIAKILRRYSLNTLAKYGRVADSGKEPDIDKTVVALRDSGLKLLATQ